MGITLRDFLQRMDRHTERVPLDELTGLIEQLEISMEDVADVAVFDEAQYRRNLLHAGPGYQALILCWTNGQRSPIHDHTGSSCGVRVLQGTATETVFKRGRDGMLMAVRTRELGEAGVCGSEDADIHQVSNLQPDGGPLVTLHVYSPPLLKMNTYSLTDTSVREYEEPIHEFCHGAGI
jgi:cysteine dioxygenase